MNNRFDGQNAAGVSGMALYVPRLRVPLDQWCDWTGNQWGKISKVVGRSFRMPTPREDVYTMAANAALRLILENEIDPQQVGMLALGTESSKDNSAGAVIVRGMLDRALAQRGLPRLARSCEVPEYKHACLGGVYALKGALRYVSHDGRGRKAIVVCGDIAEYERGSTGEQTQGAGAVAMLVEERGRLFTADLAGAGNASAFRGPDFRKPFARHFVDGYGSATQRRHDFPVFSGKYSTFSYIDETVQAVNDLLERQGVSAKEYFRSLRAMFFHRPYAHMPLQGVAFLFVRALAGVFHHSDEDKDRLIALCQEAGVPFEQVLAEMKTEPDLYEALLESDKDPKDPYPATTALAGGLRKSAYFNELLGDRLSLGADAVMDLGNLYTASLPAWLAAGFEDAAVNNVDLTGARLLAVGYGSGDAAEAIPLFVPDGWQNAARRIRFAEALEGAVDLSKEQYELLHDQHQLVGFDVMPPSGFHIGRVGDVNQTAFQDIGVDYYEYAAE